MVPLTHLTAVLWIMHNCVAAADSLHIFDINEIRMFDSDSRVLNLVTEHHRVEVQLEDHVLPETPVFKFGDHGGIRPYRVNADEKRVRFFKDSLGRGNFIFRESTDGTTLMSGFLVDGARHIVVQPASAEERRQRRGIGDWHTVSMHDVLPGNGTVDYVMPSNDVLRQYETAMRMPVPASVRAGSIERYVKMIAFVDSEIYEWQRRLLRTDDENAIFRSIQLYYTQVVIQMDDRYKSSFQADPDLHINVRLVGLVISTKQGESPWVESPDVQVDGLPVDPSGRKVAAAGPGLDIFSQWLRDNLPSVNYDFAIYFTGRNLVNDNAGLNLLGLGYLAGVCNHRWNVGASEDWGNFRSVSIAAHELGHNLGCYHDGEKSATDASKCNVTDNYIMSPSNQRSNLFNQFVFSSCSKVQMKKFLARGGDCLKISAAHAPFLTELQDKYRFLPGQFYSSSERCKAIYGTDAEPLSLDVVVQYNRNICLSLDCFTDLRTGIFAQDSGTPAPHGTPCGDGKWCNDGRCVADSNAPKGECFLGDTVVRNRFGSGYVKCSDALPLFLFEFNMRHIEDVCAGSAEFKRNCCRMCKVPGGNDRSLKNSVIYDLDVTTAMTTMGSKCEDHPAATRVCKLSALFCLNNYSITIEGNRRQIQDVCRRSCGKC